MTCNKPSTSRNALASNCDHIPKKALSLTLTDIIQHPAKDCDCLQKNTLPITPANITHWRDHSIVPAGLFICPCCFEWVNNVGMGAMLKRCFHVFCRKCLRIAILKKMNNTKKKGNVICCPVPKQQCQGILTKCEIASLLQISDNDNKIRQKTEWNELEKLESQNIVNCEFEFDCPICFATIPAGDGVKLKECFHTFCQLCLIGQIKNSTDVMVKCPHIDTVPCNSTIRDCEIKTLLNREEYEQFLHRQSTLNEQLLTNTMHCQTKNCRGFFVLEPNDEQLRCEICDFLNCIRCNAIHSPLSCDQYQGQMRNDENKILNETQITVLLNQRLAMKCPGCSAIIEKTGGCDGMDCVKCKTKLCWATRGPRWGPAGVGDTSGGCRCGVNGQKCHPQCTNCH